MLRTTTSPAAWRNERLLPPLPRTHSLEIYDLRALAPEELLAVSTLLGLVNRGAEKIYGIENADDEFWLQQLDPAFPSTRPAVTGGDLLAYLLSKYREEVAGLVIYDPALLDTRNVASTLASLRAGIVVAPELAERLQQTPYHLPVLADLRSHGWKSRAQAYAWAFKHLLADCSPDLVSGLDPRICGGLRSFLVTQRVFTCWLDPRKFLPEAAAGWSSERGLFKQVLRHFPPGSLHLGWFISEPFGIRLTSRAAILTLASDHCTNLATWSSLPVEETEQESVSEAEIAPHEGAAAEPFDARATYLSFTISDGDNLQYCQHHLLHLWHDPTRGTLPIGWTIAPALWQTMPRLAAYYRRTLSPSDILIAGPSGVAYMLPSCWPRQQRAAFLHTTAISLQKMDLKLLQVLDSQSWLSWFSMGFRNPGLQELFVSQLASSGLRGILSGAGRVFPSWRLCNGLPVYQNLGLALNPQRTLRCIRGAIARGARFINVYIFAWNMTPADLQQIARELGDEARIVSPARLLELLQQAEKKS